jgi:hypothetical protein
MKNHTFAKFKLFSILIGIVFTTCLLSLSLCSAETEKQPLNQNVQLKFTCTLNGAIPSASTKYNITLSFPNGSTYLSNVGTTALGNGAFSYDTNFTEQGLYKIQMFCYDGTYSFANEGFYDTGKNPEGIVIILFSFAFLITAGFLLYETIVCFGHLASLDLDVIDLAKTMGVYFAVIALYILSQTYFGNITFENYLLLLIKIGGFTNVIIPITGFLLSITVGSLKKKKVDFGTRRILRRNVAGNIGSFR